MITLQLDLRVRDQVIAVLRRHPSVTSAIVFGSRAKGTARPASDVDLAIEGPASAIEIARLAGDLDELSVPYRFDVQSLARITDVDLRDHIGRVGVRIYDRREV